MRSAKASHWLNTPQASILLYLIGLQPIQLWLPVADSIPFLHLVSMIIVVGYCGEFGQCIGVAKSNEQHQVYQL